MRHGSLFSGIGGFDLAAEWMGWENVFHCEWNEFGQKVLKHYWHKAISYEDITKTDFTIHRGNIDIITGGFPCQPYSAAGKRLGKEDERHLWPEMLRAIREIKPRWVVGENVYGLVNWSGGLVFKEVQADLEAEGYEVQPYLLPAVSVNAPHRRDRIWFVAHSKSARTRSDIGGIRSVSERCDTWQKDDASSPNTTSNGYQNGHKESGGQERCSKQRWMQQSSGMGREWDAADTNGIGLRRQSYGIGESGFIGKNEQRNDWENFPTVSPVCVGDDGFSDRLDGITFSKWRNESIKAGGNAVCPPLVYQIFKTIEAYEKMGI